MDRLGNRTAVNVRDGNYINYTVDNLANRYRKVADANLAYDAAGNLTRDRLGYQYEYDYENRIVKITRDGTDIAEFSYDALGRRIEKKDLVDNDNTRRYYYNDNWQVLCEYDGSGNIKAWFAYGNYIDEVLAEGMLPSPMFARYYIHNHLYSPVALISSNGTLRERYEYDVYGNPHIAELRPRPRRQERLR